MSVFKTSEEPEVHTGMLILSWSTFSKLDSSLEPEFPSLNGLQVFPLPVFGSRRWVLYVTWHCCLWLKNLGGISLASAGTTKPQRALAVTEVLTETTHSNF